jgi:predicted ATPase with chaperone activity
MLDILTGQKMIENTPKLNIGLLPRIQIGTDFSLIHGQEQAKRALLIAAAG